MTEPSSTALLQQAAELAAAQRDLTGALQHERVARTLAIRLLVIFIALTIAGVTTTAVVLAQTRTTSGRVDSTQRCIVAAFTARDRASSDSRDASAQLWQQVRAWLEHPQSDTGALVDAIAGYLPTLRHTGTVVDAHDLSDCLN